MQKYNLSIISNEALFCENIKKIISKGKDEVKRKDILLSVSANKIFSSAPNAARFFLESNTDFYTAYAVRTSCFYEDILGCITFLAFYKKSFIILFDDAKILNKGARDEISKTLKTPVIALDSIARKRFLRKSVFSVLESGLLSEYQNFYLEHISGFSKNLAEALKEKNECLMPLAPHLISSDKANIERLCSLIGIDILDNIKILKELCIALELLKASSTDKKCAVSDVKESEESLARRISEQIYTY